MSTPPPLWRTFLAFLLPMMLSNILQALFGTINSVYLGQMIGVDALAAVSVFFPVMFFLIAFVMGLSSGATVLVGQAFGAGQSDKVKAVAGTTLTVALLLAIGIALFALLFTRDLLVALATPADILDAATSYARTMMVTMPLTFAFILASSMLRGVGDTLTPLVALAISTVIGLVVTPALIRGWLGLPHLGVASAAWASAVSSLLTLIWLHLYLRRRGHALAFDAAFLRAMRPDGTLLRTVLRLGIPAALGMVVMSLAELVLLGLVNGFGSNATAAYGAVNQVLSYVQFPALSIAISVSIFGRGQAGQIGAIVGTGLKMNLILTGGLAALGYLFSRTLMGFFITDPAVLELAQGLLHIVLWSSVLFGMSTVFSGSMRAGGTVWMPLLISALAIMLVEIPSAIILSRLIGIEGVWVAYPITFCTMFLLQMAYYMLVWRKQTVERLI
ncbi:MATE family efflux transporter [Bradyrhizobium sp. Leo170]|uniref:MATE family efflux transporter n=1 Tax=Bradyrhizobium sp. Leo170 TaxID=1571199 RepID=UPI00102E87B0|nr:MATE family efflux transporter [Bradyrhizobium sp. Leo170]TAI59975.1 MATE family efflux transporter [Bradyrhizobium sp. Leo170]